MPVSFSFSLTGVNSHRTEVPNLDIMNGSILVLYSLDGKVRSPGERGLLSPSADHLIAC